MHRLWVIDHDPPLLMHAIQMMNRPDAAPEWMRIGNGGGYVGFRQQNGLGQSAASRQMAGHRGSRMRSRCHGSSSTAAGRI